MRELGVHTGGQITDIPVTNEMVLEQGELMYQLRVCHREMVMRLSQLEGIQLFLHEGFVKSKELLAVSIGKLARSVSEDDMVRMTILYKIVMD